jgi:hypothetical protein
MSVPQIFFIEMKISSSHTTGGFNLIDSILIQINFTISYICRVYHTSKVCQLGEPEVTVILSGVISTVSATDKISSSVA